MSLLSYNTVVRFATSVRFGGSTIELKSSTFKHPVSMWQKPALRTSRGYSGQYIMSPKEEVPGTLTIHRYAYIPVD
jgi:hypothetical protein